jgi:serine protease Do
MVNASVMISNDYGHGSGVFINDDVIVTAAHVLEQPDLIIELTNGVILEVSDFYIDDKEDVGFIFVDADELHIAKVSSDHKNIGDTVYLVGTPYYPDLKFTLTKGILSHLDRDIWNWKDLLQTDAEGGPGSSGGPLYDFEGQVIGICVALPNPGGGVILCESAKSILEAYERCMELRNAAN